MDLRNNNRKIFLLFWNFKVEWIKIEPIGFMEIPVDLVTNFYSFLNLKEIYKFITVSKIWFEAFFSNSLWKNLYYQRWKYNLPNPNSFFQKEYKKRREIEIKWIKYKYKTVYLEGHTSSITSSCIYKETILTGSLDNTIRQWDIKTGKSMRLLKGHNNGVNKILVYKDKFIISTCGVNTFSLEEENLPNLINFYDYIEGRLIKSIEINGRMTHFHVLNESFIYVLYVDQTFYLIHQDFDGKVLNDLKIDAMIWDLALNDKTVALGLGNGKILIHDLITKKSKEIEGDLPVNSLKYQDNILISATVQEITIWYDQPVKINTSYSLISLDSFHHEYIITKSKKNCEVFKKNHSGGYEKLYTLKHHSFVTHVYIDNFKIITCARDNLVYFWDINSGEQLYTQGYFLNQINTILVEEEIFFAGSADLTGLILDFREISNQPKKPLNYKELTPKDKIKPLKGKKKDIILVLTGAFSPIHLMHIKLLNNIKRDLETQGYNIVGGYLSPAHDAYNKFGLIQAYDRVELCEIAIKDSDWIMCDKWECSQSGFVMQDQVLQHIKDMFPDVKVSYVCGSDLLGSMSIHHLLSFGVICQIRPGYKPTFQHKNLIYCEIDVDDVSSSQIRSLLMKGEDIDKIVHPGVKEYLIKNKIKFE